MSDYLDLSKFLEHVLSNKDERLEIVLANTKTGLFRELERQSELGIINSGMVNVLTYKLYIKWLYTQLEQYDFQKRDLELSYQLKNMKREKE